MEAVRIKLKFENPSILTRKQRAEGVARCWFFLQRNVHCVADLAADIVSTFQLQQACPHGVSLAMEKFALLPYQSIYLLKDRDIVSVKERVGAEDLLQALNIKDIVARTIEESETTNGTLYHRVGNVDLCALDEFERESGGYKSEGARLDLSVGNGNGKFARQKHQLHKRQSEKWSKNSKEEYKQPSSDKPLRQIIRQNTSGKEAKHGRRDSLRATLKSMDESFADGELKKLTPNANEAEIERAKNSRKRKLGVGKLPSKKCKELCTLQQIEHIKVSKNQKECTEDWETINGRNGKAEHQKESAQPSQEAEDVPKRKKNKREKCAMDGKTVVEGKCLKEDNREIKRSKYLPESQEEENGHEPPIQSRNKNMDACETMAGGNTSLEHQGETSAQPSQEAEDVPKRKKNKREKCAMDGKTMVEGKCLKEDNRKITREPEAILNKAATIEVDLVGCTEKSRPSRSARRKKAKRQWLRKQMEGENELEHGKLEECPKKFSSSRLMQNGSLNNYLAIHGKKRIEDVEVMGEAQPTLVAPGHIRFEPLDSDEGSEENKTPMPIFHFSNDIKSKKQGRCWGKEIVDKNGHKDIKKRATGPDPLEVADAQMLSIPDKRICINFEELPSLLNFPEEGDILAYQLVELTSNWTPMLSPYRVGRVISCDKDSSFLKLDPVPGYPLTWKTDTADACSDTNFDEEESPCAPYNEDGSLEIELSSLSDVRIVEKKISVGSATRAEDPESSHKGEHNKQLLSAANLQEIDDLIVTPGFEGKNVNGGDNMSSMWKELSEELDRKKMQLFRINSSKDHNLTDKIDFLTNEIEPSNENLQKCSVESMCKYSEAKNQLLEKEVQISEVGRDRKLYSKFLKSGALGPTIALLRAQHVL